MQRAALIEQILRQVYGGYVPDDASITPMLVNQYIDQGIAFAAKTNYTDNLKLEGISFVNNSFYITFKNLAISKDERNLWKVTLPQIPVGVGYSEGISTLQLKQRLTNNSQCKKYLISNSTGSSQNFSYENCEGLSVAASINNGATQSLCALSGTITGPDLVGFTITLQGFCNPVDETTNTNPLTLPCIPITQNQKTYFQSMPHIPQQTLFYSEGEDVFIVSSVKLSDYTASVTMISGGNSTDLTSTLNIPPDYIPAVIQYVQQQLMIMKTTPKDLAADGTDLAVN